VGGTGLPGWFGCVWDADGEVIGFDWVNKGEAKATMGQSAKTEKIVALITRPP
jgi:hypothetical protein